jgi:hypothetical protein
VNAIFRPSGDQIGSNPANTTGVRQLDEGGAVGSHDEDVPVPAVGPPNAMTFEVGDSAKLVML